MNYSSYLYPLERKNNMVRPQKTRRIAKMPEVSGFNPYGGKISPKKLEPIYLLCEEYEALRLSDYERYNQCMAAAIMQISRPTFTRISQSAHEKIATAFVEGRRIIIEGGKVQYDANWYTCKDCGCLFNRIDDYSSICPLCGSNDVCGYSPKEIEEGYLVDSCRCGKKREKHCGFGNKHRNI